MSNVMLSQHTFGEKRDADSEPGEWGEELSDETEHQWSAVIVVVNVSK